MGVAGRRRALEFAWPRVAERVEGFYREVQADITKPWYGSGPTARPWWKGL